LLEDLETHIEEFPSIPVFYSRNGKAFSIVAGRVAWKGEVEDEPIADGEEVWLMERGAKKVKGWRELESIFDG
jgi:tagatose-1,6-bisphosphate aldolase